MDVKRIFRGPWFWIVLFVVAVLLAMQYLVPGWEFNPKRPALVR